MTYRYLYEHFEMLARSRRVMIGEELSRLAREEYLEDIVQHLDYMEDETLPDLDTIDMNGHNLGKGFVQVRAPPDIRWFMRQFLIDFLVEAHAAFSLQPETLFLSINLLDRYYSKRVVYVQHYQLAGCAARLIAAKYGDKQDRVSPINELDNMCCGLYDSHMFTLLVSTTSWTFPLCLIRGYPRPRSPPPSPISLPKIMTTMR